MTNQRTTTVNRMKKGLSGYSFLTYAALCLLLLSGTEIARLVVIAETVVQVGLVTDKQVYDVGNTVQISTNVMVDGTPVTDALVAVEVVSPYNNSYLVRTVKTGEIPNGNWKVQILDLHTCDFQGHPKMSFNTGEVTYIFVVVKNVDTLLAHHVKMALYVQFSDDTPFAAFYPFEMNVEAGQRVNNTVSLPIPASAVIGETQVFASVFSDSPAKGGAAYSPERTVSFYINSTTPTPTPQPQYSNITYRIPSNDAKLGNYTVFAASFYQNTLATRQLTFQVVLLGDVVKDGVVDMRDVQAVLAVFGSKAGDANWNPNADVFKDGKINMRDVATVCNDYGKTAKY